MNNSVDQDYSDYTEQLPHEADDTLTIYHDRATMIGRPPMTNQDLNRRFAELVGLCWHEVIAQDSYTTVCSCGKEIPFGQSICRNPDFISDPRLVLREMAKREDWPEFLETIGNDDDMKKYPPDNSYIYLRYIHDTPEGLLVKAGIEFLENTISSPE